jgi:hypothetical protein
VALVAPLLDLYLVRVGYGYSVIAITVMVAHAYVQLDFFWDYLPLLRVGESTLGAFVGITAFVVVPLRHSRSTKNCNSGATQSPHGPGRLRIGSRARFRSAHTEPAGRRPKLLMPHTKSSFRQHRHCGETRSAASTRKRSGRGSSRQPRGTTRATSSSALGAVCRNTAPFSPASDLRLRCGTTPLKPGRPHSTGRASPRVHPNLLTHRAR